MDPAAAAGVPASTLLPARGQGGPSSCVNMDTSRSSSDSAEAPSQEEATEDPELEGPYSEKIVLTAALRQRVSMFTHHRVRDGQKLLSDGRAALLHSPTPRVAAAHRHRLLKWVERAWRFRNCFGHYAVSVAVLSQRHELIELFCRLQKLDPSFFLPPHSHELLFLFLPSDVQYCGPGGPSDFAYDPCFPPQYHNIVMECRTLFCEVPKVASQTEEINPPAPPAHLVTEDWFPSRHVDAKFYNRLLDLAKGSEREILNLIEGATVQGDRIHAAGYEIQVESDADE